MTVLEVYIDYTIAKYHHPAFKLDKIHFGQNGRNGKNGGSVRMVKKQKSRFGPPNQLEIMNLMIDYGRLNQCLIFLGWRNR